MGRQPCCDKVGLKKGPWTNEEDNKLIHFILTNGQCCWRTLPKLTGLLRCGKSCRLRWTNYLRPDLKRGLLSEYEEEMVIDLHAKLGNRWSKIASHLAGRTDNEIKNHWNTHIKKNLIKMGIDPLTHKPISSPPQQVHQSSSPPTNTKDLVATPDDHHPTKIVELDAEESDFSGASFPVASFEEPIGDFFADQFLAPNPPSSAPAESWASSSSSSSSLYSSGSLLVDFEDLEISGFDWSCYDHGPSANGDILMSNGTGTEKGFLWGGDELSNWDLPIGVDCVESSLLPEIFSHYAQ